MDVADPHQHFLDAVLLERAKLVFFNGLRSVTNTIHSTTQLDEIILDLGRDVCSLFFADRLTIYVACDGGKSIVTKVKTGLNSHKDVKLLVADQSVAGYVAMALDIAVRASPRCSPPPSRRGCVRDATPCRRLVLEYDAQKAVLLPSPSCRHP